MQRMNTQGNSMHKYHQDWGKRTIFIYLRNCVRNFHKQRVDFYYSGTYFVTVIFGVSLLEQFSA